MEGLQLSAVPTKVPLFFPSEDTKLDPLELEQDFFVMIAFGLYNFLHGFTLFL